MRVQRYEEFLKYILYNARKIWVRAKIIDLGGEITFSDAREASLPLHLTDLDQ